MKIHEYQAKEILQQYKVAVPRGGAAFTVQEAVEVAQQLGGDAWVVKAQIHAGARGEAGGVKVAKSVDEVRQLATEFLGSALVTQKTSPKGQIIRRLLVEEYINIASEYYVSIVSDRASQQVAMISVTEDGMDIETIARKHPEKVTKVLINPLIGISDEQAQKLVAAIQIPTASAREAAQVFKNLYQLYMATDASLLEINPLVIDKQGRVIALDAKFSFDSNALYRQPEIYAMRDFDEEGPGELEASHYGLSYINLEGNIACLVNGAGLAMATMDIIKLKGGEPANFLDISGNATEEEVAAAFEIMIKKPHIKAALVNVFGGIMHCDVIATGVVAACRIVGLHIPLIVRMQGTNEALGHEILLSSGLPIIRARTLVEAAEKAIAAAKQKKFI